MSSVQSRVRNCFCKDPKKDEIFTDFRATAQGSEGTYIKANSKYFAVPIAGGGGPVLIYPTNKPGRIPTGASKVIGHAGPVTDSDFHPFNDNLYMTGSADATIKLWQLPEGMPSNVTEARTTLEGHSKRVLLTLFHPAANNVLASADFNKELFIWDVTKSDEPVVRIEYTKAITDLKWNHSGTMLGTTSKDHVIRCYDPRQGLNGDSTVNFTDCHLGNKSSKMCFIDNQNYVMSFGATKSARRECKVWDIRKPGKKHIKKVSMGTGSGVLLPFYDRSTNLVFIGGKGDSTVRIMEVFSDDPITVICTQPRFTGSAKGYCVAPKRSVDVKSCEVLTMYRLRPDVVEPLHFKIPRKATNFQKDIYMEEYAGAPSMQSDEWFAGANEPPVLMSLDPKKRPASNATGAVEFKKAKSRADIEVELEAAKYKARVLKAEIELYNKQLKGSSD